MIVQSAQVITADFVTSSPATGAATIADSLPVGTLIINGTDNAASVTVTSKTGGKYNAAVTLPTLANGDTVQLRVAATVATVAGIGVVWQATGSPQVDLIDDPNATAVAAVKTGLGTLPADLVSIGGTILAGTGALISAAFSKFFNKATPTGTINSLPDAVPGAGPGVSTATNVASVVTPQLVVVERVA